MISVGEKKNVSYFKRFKMELDLYEAPPASILPPRYYWVRWEEWLLDRHAEVMFASFHDEIDATVFPSLGDRHGSRCLMTEIRHRPGFIREATWLLGSPDGYCG